MLHDLNYHHLRYFWMVAREGSVQQASRLLHLAQPTLSMQIRTLERSLGVKLFARSGRLLALTETGRTVYRYADEIFSLGKELTEALHGLPRHRSIPFLVGVADSLTKLIVQQMLQPAWQQPEPISIVCTEGTPNELLARLALYELDVVLSDAPAPASVRVQAYSHQLGHSQIAVFGTSKLVKKYRPGFPHSLRGAPFLVSTTASTVRRRFETWLEQEQLSVQIRGEFADSALMKVVGHQGIGLFLAPVVVAPQVIRQYNVKQLGILPGVREEFYAISVERRLRHPCVVAIAEQARGQLFA
ncbi:MAG: transcriptional activator NhaR [Gemmatales bacterium]